MRNNNRAANALRDITFTLGASKHAEGSCLVQCGDTHVLCTASFEAKVPPFLKGQGKGWVTAEYGMLPRSTHERMDREAAKGKQSGRTQEIQRLIGRALRAVVDTGLMGETQIKVDCDVLQADGGTRTAAITGSYLALHQAFSWAMANKKIKTMPLREAIAAISCGIIDGAPVLDLDYSEDSRADADANFVMTESGLLVEVQATAEGVAFDRSKFDALMNLASEGIAELIAKQKVALSEQKAAA
jgi:ribonuclease PH